jgi:Family of unknown function (DUF5996)
MSSTTTAAQPSSHGAAPWPDLAEESWPETLATLHRFTQLVGKIRLAAAPRRNHWWNVAFSLTGRGLTTRPMGSDPIFTIDFDLLSHRLEATTVDGLSFSFPLHGKSVAAFTAELRHALRSIGARAWPEHPHPYDLPDAARPFAEDQEHAAYDPAPVTRWWQTMSRVNLILEEFAAGWAGKTSPVHLFWHGLDIAVTRFSDRHVDPGAKTDPVNREAYSREVISFGFWFGDDSLPEPAFYSYTAPEPAGLTDESLEPRSARWTERPGSHLAVLTYDDARRQPDPHGAVLEFFESAFHAGAARAGWDVARDASLRGVTDPYAPRDYLDG